MATNRIDALDPALIRPGRIDRKIEFPLPDEKTKRRIFNIHTSRMKLADDVDLEEYIMSKDDLSGADIKVRRLNIPALLPFQALTTLHTHTLSLSLLLVQAICSEAGLMALRERRTQVNNEDFKKSKENVLYRKQENVPQGLYL